VERGIAEVYQSGGVERIEFTSAAFVTWLEEISAEERRKIAEQIAGAIAGTPKPEEAYWRVWAARIARQTGEARA
jgi:hypothetical protein